MSCLMPEYFPWLLLFFGQNFNVALTGLELCVIVYQYSIFVKRFIDVQNVLKLSKECMVENYCTTHMLGDG